MENYINYLNDPITNFFINLILIFSLLIPSVLISNSSKIYSFGLLINFTTLIIINNILIIALILLQLDNYLRYSIFFFYFISILIYFRYGKGNLLKFSKQINNLVKFLFNYKIFFLGFILLFISTFIVALDGDSYTYHLALPYKLIINNFDYLNESWFHTNLVSYAEVNNLFGLIYGSDNYVSLLNFIYFFILLLFLIEYFQLKKINQNLIILFFSTPFFYFLIISQKFFFGPIIVIGLSIFNFLKVEKNISFKYLSVFFYAVLTKITFYIYPLIFIVSCLNINLKLLKKFIFKSILVFPILFLFLYLFRIKFFEFPYFPFYVQDSPLTFLFEDWVSDQKQFLKFTPQLLLNIIVPTSIYNLTNFLGIFSFYFFLVFIIKNNLKDKLVILIILIFSLLLFQTSTRFYFLLFFLSLLFSIDYISINFSIIKRNFLIFLSYTQFFLLISLLLFSLYLFGSSIFDSKSREDILTKHGYDYIYFKKLDEFLIDNNMEVGIISYSRSNLFNTNIFSSIELISSVITSHSDPDRLEFINHLKRNNIQYIFADKVDFNTHYFLNCIRNELIFETGDINTSARNPAYLKSKNFQLYSLNKKIDNCFKP